MNGRVNKGPNDTKSDSLKITTSRKLNVRINANIVTKPTSINLSWERNIPFAARYFFTSIIKPASTDPNAVTMKSNMPGATTGCTELPSRETALNTIGVNVTTIVSRTMTVYGIYIFLLITGRACGK